MNKVLDKLTVLSKVVRFSKKIVISVIILTILFTIVMIFIYLKTGMIPDTLVVEWFNFFGKEILALGGIKISEVVLEVVREAFNNKKEDYHEY